MLRHAGSKYRGPRRRLQVLLAVLLSFTMLEEYSSFTSGMPLTLLFPLGLIITFVGVYFLN